MGKVARKRGERALTELIGVLDQARQELVRRLDDVDLEAMRRQGSRLAGSMGSEVRSRMRPPRRRVSPRTVAGLSGLVALGLAAAAGAGYVLYDRERRAAARRRLADVQSRARDVQSRARERYAELTGGRTPAEEELEAKARAAIAEGGAPPDGLEVAVEGRTVYLRGAVPDPAFVDAAAERVHAVPGVVAVVNLTTSKAPIGASPV